MLASEISGLFTVDLSKLFRSSDFGKNIISTNNKARQEHHNENDQIEIDNQKINNQIKEFINKIQGLGSFL